MSFFRRPVRPQPESQPTLPSLAQSAQENLARAASAPPAEQSLVSEERSVWQPESWLLQRCWESLADAGACQEALTAAKLSPSGQQLALVRAIHRLAVQVGDNQAQMLQVREALLAASVALLHPLLAGPLESLVEQLLLASSAASLLRDDRLALALLERLDQLPGAWERVFVAPAERARLAETVARIGSHPLTNTLTGNALRRYGDAGADFLQQIAEHVETAPGVGRNVRAATRLLQRSADALRYGALTTLHTHRVAAVVLARAGFVNETLQHLTVIANIQEARREAGISTRSDDQSLLRQVKRPRANPDIDFQVYTLREAVRLIPLQQMSREQRAELANRLAALAVLSDGWTAASAASTLVDLGAIQSAIAVVQRINAEDPTRSEGVIALVRSLLAIGELNLAQRQTDAAVAWVRGLNRRNPERALIWGVAQAYLEFGYPQRSLELLQQWRVETGFRQRLSTFFGAQMNDDDLRLKRLRLQGLLDLHKDKSNGEVDSLVQELRVAGPRLLDGDALISFYVDGLLRPLLTAGRTAQAWTLLPEICGVLAVGSGSKHGARVREISVLLARQARLETASGENSASREPLTRFLLELWRGDVKKGIWQVVHSIEGAIPLLLALEGPAALVAIAESAAAGWGETRNETTTG